MGNSKMKNYDDLSSGWFKTDKEEIDKLRNKGESDLVTYGDSLSRLKNHFNDSFPPIDIIAYVLKEVPYKRSKFDNAVLLCAQLSNHQWVAKRHNNSQWLKIH